MRPLVLIVDDNASSAVMLGRLLRGDGYDTEVVVDGHAALARLERPPGPAALITDFHLPYADGLVVGRRARAVDADIPIFVVTGDPTAVADVPHSMALELVSKPIDYEDFVLRLNAAIATAP